MPSLTCFMDLSSITALSQLGIHWHNINHLDHDYYSSLPLEDQDHSHLSYFQTTHLPHSNQLKSNAPTWNPQPAQQLVTAPKTTTFPTHTNYPHHDSSQNHNYACKRAGGSRSPAHTHHHIIAERKRREKLSQKFIALSAIIPGLKKMDKASVLGGAIRYLKQLQERVKLLEEQTSKKTTECAVLVSKSQLFADADKSCFVDSFSGEAFPEIEVRFCEKSVLIRIHCEKRKGAVEKAVEEIEKCHLSVINSSVMTFGSCALDITTLAQMDMQFCMTAKDLVKNLRSALQLIMC